jgi:hypothetical protein
VIKRFDILTNAGGSFVGTLKVEQPALLVAMQWMDGDLADGVDATMTHTQFAPGNAVTTLFTLTDANNDAPFYPRVVEHDTAGAALATRTMALCHGTLTLTVAAGGNAKAGQLWLYLLTLED